MMKDSRSEAVQRPNRPLLVCLLPARNAAKELPGWFASMERCCDAIVALDDGSTDDTAQILDRHPLVKVLLRNPPRADFHGWDDAANRNRLLEAAQQLDHDWLISLDADERIDAQDAESLRRFLETDALPGCAYGFRHVPMHHDGEHFLPRYHWMYRLFSAGPDQRFPSQKLHFAPIPTAIPRHRWIRTTLRIQHFGELTAAHRLRRFHKYLMTDPWRRYQGDYAQLLAPGPADDELRRWQPRPDSIPVLLEQTASGMETYRGDEGATVGPVMSVIVFAHNAEGTIVRTVAAVLGQEVPAPFEVIVVVSGKDRTASLVRGRFPDVTLVDLDYCALPGDARNAGLAVAQGVFVVFTEAHVVPLPGNLAARLRAHQRGYAMVTGLVVNGTTTPAGWASYFLDHAEKLPGHTAAEFNGPPGRCSYARLPLLEVGGFPEGVRTGEDTAANRALARRGYAAYRDPTVQLIHYSRCRTLPRLIRHHFRRGRGWGRIVTVDYRARGHLLDRNAMQRHGIASIRTRLRRIEAGVAQAQPELMAPWRRHRRLITIGAFATWLGMWYEMLRPSPGGWSILFGRPVMNVLVVETGDAPALTLVQIDTLTGAITRQPIAPSVMVPYLGRLAPLPDIVDAASGADLGKRVRAALGVPAIECLVVPSGGVSKLVNGEHGTGPLTRIWRVASVATEALAGWRGEAIRSTLPWWRTVAVVARLRGSREAHDIGADGSRRAAQPCSRATLRPRE